MTGTLQALALAAFLAAIVAALRTEPGCLACYLHRCRYTGRHDSGRVHWPIPWHHAEPAEPARCLPAAPVRLALPAPEPATEPTPALTEARTA